MIQDLQSGYAEFIDFDHSLPDHKLRAAVIFRAVWDFIGPTLSSHARQFRGRPIKEDARDWLTSNDGPDVEGSFRWYLQGLVDNPEALRTKILAKCGLLH